MNALVLLKKNLKKKGLLANKLIKGYSVQKDSHF